MDEELKSRETTNMAVFIHRRVAGLLSLTYPTDSFPLFSCHDVSSWRSGLSLHVETHR